MRHSYSTTSKERVEGRAGNRRAALLLGALLLLAAGRAAGQDPAPQKGFTFGSYGRVGFGTTEEGRGVTSYDFVAHPPRLFESPYVELDLGYALESTPEKYIKVLVTTALMGNLFHFTGSPAASVAIRNLYVEMKGYVWKHLTVWAGSRMYRGDDIYLVDYWPMDSLNTIGGGVMLAPGAWDLRLHVGVNRLNDDFQYQEIAVEGREGTAPETVVFMDRQRLIVSLKLTYFFLPDKGSWKRGAKVSLYGEVHSLSDGYRFRDDAPAEHLPEDLGWLVGAQGGAWGFAPGFFANLWLKAAGGLAAYGELAIPFGLGTDKKSTRARDFTAGLSLNFEAGVVGLLAGAYVRWFKDADPNVYDTDDFWEGVFVARVQFYVTPMIHLALEAGESFKRTTGLSTKTPEFDPEKGGFAPPAHETPSMTHAALFLVFSPFGRGTLTRPQVRLFGSLQAPNAAARHLYPAQDTRAGGGSAMDNLIWCMGLQAEWWFNSSYR